MKRPNQTHFVVLILLVMFLETSPLVLLSQTEAVKISNPVSEIPYEIPTKENITKVLEQVRDYIIRATPYRVIDKKTGKEIKDFSEINPNAVVDTRTGGFNLWIYTMGVVHSGMLYAGDVLNDPVFTNYAFKNYDFVFNHLPYFRKQAGIYGLNKQGYIRIIQMSALDHCGSIGAALIQTYAKKKDPRYRAMIDTVAEYISHKQFRLEDGTFARNKPQPNSLWIDDCYMSIPFLAQMGKLTGDRKYFDDAVKQVIQFSDRLFIWEKKLFDHGWSTHAEFDPKFYWGRGNGWVMMAIVELLSILPEQYPGRDQILKILRTHVQGIAERQGGQGLWHNVLDRTDSYLETSCTAMFVYSIARAVNKEWVDHTYGSVAQAGWNALSTKVLPDGQIEGICIGTAFASDMVYYYHRPTSVHALHGYGPALLAGAEMIQLLQNEKIKIKKYTNSFQYRLKEE